MMKNMRDLLGMGLGKEGKGVIEFSSVKTQVNLLKEKGYGLGFGANFI